MQQSSVNVLKWIKPVEYSSFNVCYRQTIFYFTTLTDLIQNEVINIEKKLDILVNIQVAALTFSLPNLYSSVC